MEGQVTFRNGYTTENKMSDFEQEYQDYLKFCKPAGKLLQSLTEERWTEEEQKPMTFAEFCEYKREYNNYLKSAANGRGY